MNSIAHRLLIHLEFRKCNCNFISVLRMYFMVKFVQKNKSFRGKVEKNKGCLDNFRIKTHSASDNLEIVGVDRVRILIEIQIVALVSVES